MKKSLILLAVTLTAFTAFGQNQMTNRTAVEFFQQEGIRAGWNLGNTLDAHNVVNGNMTAVEGAWGAPRATQAMINGVRAQGFDFIRIPVTWAGHIGGSPNFTLTPTWLNRVTEVVGWARTAGFKAIIINIHHDGFCCPTARGFVDMRAALENNTRKEQIQNQIGVVWRQIATHFRDYGEELIFETLNEVHAGGWGSTGGTTNREQDILFDWNQAALNAIRATGGNNATRFVAVPTVGSTEPEMVIAAHARNRLIPTDGTNGTRRLMVSVHYYHPWRYTVADATNQTGNDGLLHTWGTTAERSHPNTAMASLRTTFINNGIGVYIGEWGAPTDVRSSMNATIRGTHLDYIHSVAAAARANGVVPMYWDDGGWFRMLSRTDGRPAGDFHRQVLDTMMAALNAGNTGGNQRTLTINRNPTAGGNVTVNGTQQNTGSSNHANNASVTVAATPNTGYTFQSWTGAPSGVTATNATITFNINANITLTANFQQSGNTDPVNLVRDGNFPGNSLTTAWVLNSGQYHGNSAATASVSGGRATINITAVGADVWQPSLVQSDIHLVQGRRYRLTFNASAVSARAITTVIQRGSDPWTDYGRSNFNLTTNAQDHTFEFTMNAATDPSAQLAFHLGATTANVTISNVRLFDITTTSTCDGFIAPSVQMRNSAVPSVMVRSNMLTVGASPETNVQIRIVNLSGKTVVSINTQGGTTHSLSHIPAGTYIVEVGKMGGAVVRQRVLVRK